MNPKPWLLLATMLALSTPANASLYTINLDGPYLDLSGYIVTDAVGTFSPYQFDALTSDYSITASLNGAYPFTFTRDNSNWGQRLQPSGEHCGDWLNVTVTSDKLTISSWWGLWDCAGNCFLITNVPTNGHSANLTISDNIWTYYPGAQFNMRVLDTAAGNCLTFLDPSPAPLPPAVWLFGSGLLGLIGWKSKGIKK